MNKPRFPLQRQPGNLCGVAPSWQETIPGTRLSKSASTRNAVQGLTLRVAAQSTEMSLGTFSSIFSGNTPRVRHVPGHGSTMGTDTAGGKQRKTISSQRSLGAGSIMHREPATPWRRDYGTGSRMGRVRMLQEARNRFLAACQDLSPSKA